jgi:hypothetical protein
VSKLALVRYHVLTTVTSRMLIYAQDIVLSLVDKKGNSNGGFLAVRAAEHHASVVVSALQQNQNPNQNMKRPVIDGYESTFPLKNLILGRKAEPILDSVLNKLQTLLQIGDEVSKVSLWSSLASCVSVLI